MEKESNLVKNEKKAIAVEIIDPFTREISEDSFEEFKLLIETLGYEIVAETTQMIRNPNYAFFLGKGKVNEIRQIVRLLSAEIVFIDTKLTYLQIRNLSKEIGVPVVDRPHLILMIFDMRAKTKEGKLQVELSELKMHLPEIVHSGIYLDQQVGSEIGLKGPGEKKTELKRRYIEKRIKVLEKKLLEIRKQRKLRRKKRKKNNIPIVAIVGYTNSGKSTLLNRLTTPDAYVEDMLFSTLDTLVREASLDGEKVLFVDTIGFIRELPPILIYAFHSTLEEILDAWIILLVADVSVPDFDAKIDTVLKTINELGASNIPRILVFNKVDKISEEKRQFLERRFPDAVFISALQGKGIERLKDRIKNEIEKLHVNAKLFIPHSEQRALSKVYDTLEVVKSENVENGAILIVKGFKQDVEKFRKYMINDK
jgi:GTP-binding protein HflX